MCLRADMDALPVKELQEMEWRSEVVDNEYPGGPFPVSERSEQARSIVEG